LSSVSIFTTALEEMLKEKGMSGAQLSKALGYRHEHTVRRWLDGLDRPAISQLPEIANLFNVSLIQLGLIYLMDASSAIEEAMRAHLGKIKVTEEPMASDLLWGRRRRFDVPDPHDAPRDTGDEQE